MGIMEKDKEKAIRIIESDYEVKLGIFEGPLDLLLYLVQKNELDPKQISIATITDQYLVYIDSMPELNLSNAGEFLVMAARLMRLKTRELLPAEQKDELEEMEYELDKQALIAQMLEYQKFKEAARVLRNFEARHFGALPRGITDAPDTDKDELGEEEAGVYGLLSAFRKVVLEAPKPVVHEVEIDDVTIEDRMQEIDTLIQAEGRSLFEDLFQNDPRVIAKVVTFMAILELVKLDKILLRQSHAMSSIWVFRKQNNANYEIELNQADRELEALPEFKAGLVEIVKEAILRRQAENSLETVMRELEEEMQAMAQMGTEAATTPPATVIVESDVQE